MFLEYKKDFEIQVYIGIIREVFIKTLEKYFLGDHMVTGIIAGLLTFFLGFIGTFIVRIAIVKHPFEETLKPTFIHFLLNLAIVIPVVGFFIALIGNIYFAWVNFQLAKQS